jgi:hypothetical protein
LPWGERKIKGLRRSARVSNYRRAVEAAQHYNATDAFKPDLAQRPRVERIIAALVHYNGAREARRRGKFRCDFQAKTLAPPARTGVNAAAYNLKKWMHLRYFKHGFGNRTQLTMEIVDQRFHKRFAC